MDGHGVTITLVTLSHSAKASISMLYPIFLVDIKEKLL